MRKFLAGCLASLLAATVSFSAQAGDTYKFDLHNESSEYIITGFYTFEGGKWSKNWINFTLKPGESAEMDWGSDDGNCVVPFKVSWKGYEAEKFTVDWCKVHNLYMKDNGFRYD